ncbi:hypothetical protein BpHYR1_051277 [Brachionus plicatilis]|uniref:Uncharacterized protein n=1 Tax=Brachionus plicatilis TaxID=10195 RepID=A0A3M7T8S8_BRAPC|nr:hypothetical protein BpHYR1_051277 [Brachionus plicatilis]
MEENLFFAGFDNWIYALNLWDNSFQMIPSDKSTEKVCFNDGSFDISPTVYKQTFTINILKNNWNFPLIFASLTDNLEIEKIKRLIMCDFEKAEKTVE